MTLVPTSSCGDWLETVFSPSQGERLLPSFHHVGNRRTETATLRKIERELERYKYSTVFDVSLEPISLKGKSKGKSIASFHCTVKLKPEEWKRRQRYNGFVLLLAHPVSGGQGAAKIAATLEPLREARMATLGWCSGSVMAK